MIKVNWYPGLRSGNVYLNEQIIACFCMAEDSCDLAILNLPRKFRKYEKEVKAAILTECPDFTKIKRKII